MGQLRQARGGKKGVFFETRSICQIDAVDSDRRARRARGFCFASELACTAPWGSGWARARRTMGAGRAVCAECIPVLSPEPWLWLCPHSGRWPYLPAWPLAPIEIVALRLHALCAGSVPQHASAPSSDLIPIRHPASTKAGSAESRIKPSIALCSRTASQRS